MSFLSRVAQRIALKARAHLPCAVAGDPVHVPHALDGLGSLHVIVAAAMNAHGVAFDRASLRAICRQGGQLGSTSTTEKQRNSPAICTVSHRRESDSTQNCMISGERPERVAW